MTGLVLSPPPKRWECAHCFGEAVTPWDTPNRFHDCPALAGITAPMVPAGSGARVFTVERDDYVGTEDVRYNGHGRPIMAVITERPDGSNDTIVFAPTAHGGGGA